MWSNRTLPEKYFFVKYWGLLSVLGVKDIEEARVAESLACPRSVGGVVAERPVALILNGDGIHANRILHLSHCLILSFCHESSRGV